MKLLFAASAVFCIVLPVSGGESGLMRTFQPLDGTGSISIEQVACYVSNFDSGQVSPIRYISIKNIPPTTSEKPSGDRNLASTSNLNFDCQNSEEKEPKLFMNADGFVVSRGYSREVILRASLECLRRLLPPMLLKTTLKFTSSPENREWMSKIVDEFNKHDRNNPFYNAPE